MLLSPAHRVDVPAGPPGLVVMAIANTPTVKATAMSVAAAAWMIGISFRTTSATFVEQSTQRVDNFADGFLVRLRPRCVVHEDTISGKHQHVG